MTMTPRRAGLVLAVVVAAVLVLTVLGRHERASANSHQVTGIRRTAELAGSRRPSAYRIASWADCLLYPVGADPYALEVCFDARGRGLAAIDRRHRSRTRIWSVRYHPSLTRVRRSPAGLFRTFEALRAFPAAMRFTGNLPLAASFSLAPGTQGDTGPILVRGRRK